MKPIVLLHSLPTLHIYSY